MLICYNCAWPGSNEVIFVARMLFTRKRYGACMNKVGGLKLKVTLKRSIDYNFAYLDCNLVMHQVILIKLCTNVHVYKTLHHICGFNVKVILQGSKIRSDQNWSCNLPKDQSIFKQRGKNVCLMDSLTRFASETSGIE